MGRENGMSSGTGAGAVTSRRAFLARSVVAASVAWSVPVVTRVDRAFGSVGSELIGTETPSVSPSSVESPSDGETQIESPSSGSPAAGDPSDSPEVRGVSVDSSPRGGAPSPTLAADDGGGGSRSAGATGSGGLASTGLGVGALAAAGAASVVAGTAALRRSTAARRDVDGVRDAPVEGRGEDADGGRTAADTDDGDARRTD